MERKRGQLVMWAVMLSVLTLVGARAQSPGTYGIGDVIKDFRLKNVDDRQVSLQDYRTQKGVIVVFTSNHCPFAKSYEDRIQSVNQRYGGQGYPVVAIQSNDPAAYEDDSFDNMKARSRERSYSFPYLFDETQQVARLFGVTKTPQVYVLKQTGGQFTLQYTGAIDDNPQDANSVRVRYLEDALTSLIAGKAVINPVTRPIGCAIKWK
ncbi:thioredoxin family protein [Arsenicibacter rosenii]|uniref:Thioredoxin family protein n=1 Tax=Arsenicibacter rosenii TaxID=1750698 RepID=A0A1S2VG38_9BACT|nr:thioredoxin family protein [Arsenicibacter rosenii]OIN57682.1 thioredoxin family protein [Arsenicibacter rosenii]